MNANDFPERVTLEEKYGPAMVITEQAEADGYFERCVRHGMLFGNSREEAERIERENLGYYAGYYDAETAERVHRLFKTEHPIFGKRTPTAEEAFAFGRKWATEGKEKPSQESL